MCFVDRDSTCFAFVSRTQIDALVRSRRSREKFDSHHKVHVQLTYLRIYSRILIQFLIILVDLCRFTLRLFLKILNWNLKILSRTVVIRNAAGDRQLISVVCVEEKGTQWRNGEATTTYHHYLRSLVSGFRLQ